MEAEAVLNLFDSTWFYLEILEKQPKTTSNNPAVSQMIQLENHSPKQSQLTIETRSKSFDMRTANLHYIPLISPNSVLHKPHHLQTILSEREFSPEIKKKPITKVLNINKKKKRLSKSLSELEFEELKGFMDLGFVFSEEDKMDSSLADIIPGLHKLGQKKKMDYNYLSDDHYQEGNVHAEHERARPYLSEVWERENEERELLMKWRVPVDIVGNEIDMKDSLKWWAHSVIIASAAVR